MRVHVLVFLAVLLSVSYGLLDEEYLVQSFHDYANSYQKPYAQLRTSHPIWRLRYEAYKVNYQRVENHNRLYQTGQSSFALGLNNLADMTDEEYQSLLGYKSTRTVSNTEITRQTGNNTDMNDLPNDWDWRENNTVTPIKNQGMCGSCWSFSAVAAMECAYAKVTKNLVSMSEQELIDCVDNGQDTCQRGGEMTRGFEEIIYHRNGKIEKEDDYNYTASSKGICYAKNELGIGHFTSYVNVTSGNEQELKRAVAENCVTSVAIDASSFYFQLYHHGVFYWPFCKNKLDELDHGVAVAGYGTYKGKDFWLVKNSWGLGWGMEGYIMMARNRKNHCGIATDASYPVMTPSITQMNTLIATS